MTKFVSKEWMVEKGYYDINEIKEEVHQLNGIPASELKLKPLKKYTEKSKIKDILEEFERGEESVPIIMKNKVFAVLVKKRVMAAILRKKATKEDEVTKVWYKEFSAMPIDQVDCANIERLLSRHPCVFLMKFKENGDLDEVFRATSDDIFKLIK